MVRGTRFLLAAAALPILQFINLIAYARLKEGKFAQLATFVTLIPIFAITCALWGICVGDRA
jgi:hypothetical protein